jgi:hypothetical protein
MGLPTLIFVVRSQDCKEIMQQCRQKCIHKGMRISNYWIMQKILENYAKILAQPLCLKNQTLSPIRRCDPTPIISSHKTPSLHSKCSRRLINILSTIHCWCCTFKIATPRATEGGQQQQRQPQQPTVESPPFSISFD